MEINQRIFEQNKPGAGDSLDLYVVPESSTAFGTLYIAAQNGYDIVSVQLIPAADLLPENKHYIMYRTELVGWVPIYLQQIYLGPGDRLRISSVNGDSGFTFTGELYT
jgi:hypothetical protein